MPDPTGSSLAAQQSSKDAFFVLKDCRELFQRRLVEIAVQSGISSPAVIDAFSREIGKAHDELAASTRPEGFEQTAGLTASRITLVGNDDLELEIRIGNIINRLKGEERIDYWRVQLRYMTLLHRPKMGAENNPVGLEPVARGLWVIGKENGDTLDQNLDHLDRLEEMLQLQLPEVYMELNALLERNGVAPAQVKAIQKESNNPSTIGSSTTGVINNTASSANALSALQQTLYQQFGGESANPAANYVAGSSTENGEGRSFALNATAIVMLNHLMERLNMLEHQQASVLPNNNSSLNSIGRVPLHAIKSKDLDLPLGQSAAIALDTLSLIFEAIFTAPDHPDVVKAAIGRLQIPLLKLAILDPSFFADTQHPARRLIDRMARAAIGLAQETGKEHPLCARLGEQADAIRIALEKNDVDLSPYLDELETMISERDQLLQENARPYTKLVSEHENLESSRAMVQNWLSKIQGKTSEPAIVKFLSEHWFRVMQTACQNGGTEGQRWKEADATIEELIWSIQPKQTAEERKQLLGRIPLLIKRITIGLDILGIPAEERKPFLDACFALQTAALRSHQEAPAVQSPPPQAATKTLMAPLFPHTADAALAPTVQRLEQNGTIVHYLGQPTEIQSPWRTNGINAWKKGDWISFSLPDGKHLCGHHCWTGAPSGTILLFNPCWGYAVALAPALLEQQLRNGLARVVSDVSLFDDATERALGTR